MFSHCGSDGTGSGGSIDINSWIEFNGRRYRVLQVEDPNERGEYYEILATERGDRNLLKNQA